MASTKEKFEALQAEGKVRIEIFPSDMAFEDLEGDTYNPQTNPDIPEAQLAAERKAEIERVNQEGVWFISAQYLTAQGWKTADSCGGFIGEDWEGSGYDVDMMHAAIEAFEAYRVCPCCKGTGREA